jgi:uncharacterized membrane protein YagU involved in acid resistance
MNRHDWLELAKGIVVLMFYITIIAGLFSGICKIIFDFISK